MRLLSVFLGLVLSFQVSANNTWQWLHDCQQQNNKTECTVWFNQLDSVGKVNVKHGRQTLPVEQHSFVQTQSASANALLLHLQGATVTQREELQKGLNGLLDRQQNFQKFALYASSGSLQVMAPLGASKAQLKQAISGVNRLANASHPVNDLLSVIGMVGSSAEQRRVVYWLSVGTNISQPQIAQIKQKLAQEKVRLVILNLAVSELARNSFPSLSRLANEVSGLYINLAAAQWAGNVAKLADYSNNGVRLSVDTRGLCGRKKLSFSASAHANLSTDRVLNYPTCVNTPVPVATESLPADSPTTLDPSETASSENSSPETPASTEEPANSGELETPAGENAEPVTPSTVPTTDTPTAATVIESAPHWLWWGIAALVCLLLLLLFFLLKKRKQPVSSKEAEQEQTIYGYLMLPSIEGSQRFALDKASSKMGRSQENDVVFNDDTVSGIHAQIKFERNGDVVLIDLQSSNGTYVNGEEIMQHKLQLGDEITLGSYQFKFGG
ncbi:MAG: FHA domain-containing protein [Methyloprofundus sp.]|nr:FHA domain-containing protein [Methyloprofundus sp.]